MAKYYFAWAGIWNNDFFYQDNQSSIRMKKWETLFYWKPETNKHQVFFVKDTVDKGEVKI